MSEEEVRTLCQEQCVVVIDEAYYEFSGSQCDPFTQLRIQKSLTKPPKACHLLRMGTFHLSSPTWLSVALSGNDYHSFQLPLVRG